MTTFQTQSMNYERYSEVVDRIAQNVGVISPTLPRGLQGFAHHVSRGRYEWHRAMGAIGEELEAIVNGDTKRLMIFMPPRHGKSELVSRLFSAYYLYRHPERWVGINSYAAELAYTFSRAARDNFREAGGQLRGDASAVKHWQTEQGGGLWAAGVGGPITGKGYHLGIIDDPLKNAEEAASETIRDKQWEWYLSTFTTRAEPDAAIVVIQTRWHQDDLSGRILEHERGQPEGWAIAHFEALAEKDIPGYPSTCDVLGDWREVGEALVPERFGVDDLEAIKQRSGSYFWSSLYQQRPTPREGNMFKRAWFDIVSNVPGRGRFVRYWDKAGTTDGGDYTAGILMAVVDGTYYVVDLVMGQWAAGERERVIRQTAFTDQKRFGDVEIGVEQEPGSSGKESAENTIRNLPGFRVYADRPTGDKELRAEPLAAQAEINNVKIVDGDWNARYLDIITAFPTGSIDDPVDASSGAFARLVKDYKVKVRSYV